MKNDRTSRKQLQQLDSAQLAKVHGGFEALDGEETLYTSDASSESRYNFTNAMVSKISNSTLKI